MDLWPGLLRLPLGLLFFLISPSAADLPYNPTRAFLSQQRNDLAYILRPSTTNPNQAELLSIDIASTFDVSSAPVISLFPSLPFLNGSSDTAYISTIDTSGNITVYAGDCSRGGVGSKIWRFMPYAQAQHGNGTWEQDTVSLSNISGSNILDGANYLASSIAFSSTVNGSQSDMGFYVFGGMCPHSDATPETWTYDADYSNSMLTLEPQSLLGGDESYGHGLTSSRGPPIAEAGFTIIALPPSFSNSDDGTQTQQQDFVLVGGHTQTAFINMSQIALFSLPQQGWTFLSVNQPSNAGTALSRRDSSQVEPRSGHTAVISADGSKIVVFGGWVGDVNTPAQPQLAVLNAGEGYGGTGSWFWTVPEPVGSGLATGTGIYGHDAILLPGDVMMVVGGNQIGASGSAKSRRQSSDLNVMFFNVSSNSWTTNYTPPENASNTAAQGDKSGLLSTTSQKAGLGAGLGIGAVAVTCLGVFYWWFARRLKKKREDRERDIREYNGSASDFHARDLGRDGQDGMWPGTVWSGHHRDPSGGDYLWSTRTDDLGYNNGWRNISNQDAERTGLLVEIPSPTRGLRRGRGGHLQPRHDENRISVGSGAIHPIEEKDEEEHAPKGPEMTEKHAKHASSLFSNAPSLNPFRDPDPLGSHPIGTSEANSSMAVASNDRPPLISTKSDEAVTTLAHHRSPSSTFPTQNAKGREREVAGWVSDWQAADALLHTSKNHDRPMQTGSQRTGGRLSPTKNSDRTDSSLSDGSYRSNLSYSGASVARTISQKSAALLSLNPFSGSQPSPDHERSFAPSHGRASRDPTDIHSGPHENDNDSFITAHTTLSGPQPTSAQPSPTKTNFPLESSRPRYYAPATESEPTDPSALVAAASSAADLHPTTPTKPRLRWVGSVRKALGAAAGISSSTYGRSSSMTSTTSAIPRWARSRGGSFSMDPAAAIAAAVGESGKTSPAKGTSSGVGIGAVRARGGGDSASGLPRRAASEGGFFWRGKKGARDWEEDATQEEQQPSFPPYRDEDGGGGGVAEGGTAVRPRRLQRRDRRRPQTTVGMREDNAAWMREHGIGGGGGGGGGGGIEEDGRRGMDEDEDDWDVEAAVERRLVQVMFTVPKQRLRVVNTDVDKDSVRSRSDAGGPADADATDTVVATKSTDPDSYDRIP
ncbi:MAG: hypothetical protein Q9165_000687 [Trypethelium subeluteriae]